MIFKRFRILKFCDRVRNRGHFTEKDYEYIDFLIKEKPFVSYTDTEFVSLVDTIFDTCKDKDVLKLLINKVVSSIDNNSISTCGSSCNESCAFHKFEFGE